MTSSPLKLATVASIDGVADGYSVANTSSVVLS